jgi:hypothetical protein
MEGRKFTRADCSFGASIRFGSELTICKTENLSFHGMYLNTDRDIPINTPVSVIIYNSNNVSLKVDAKVVRKETNGLGLEISKLNAYSFAKLRSIVAENSGDHGTLMQETLSMLKSIQ